MSFKKISSYNQYHMFEMESHLEHQYRTEKRWSCFNLRWRKGIFSSSSLGQTLRDSSRYTLWGTIETTFWMEFQQKDFEKSKRERSPKPVNVKYVVPGGKNLVSHVKEGKGEGSQSTCVWAVLKLFLLFRIVY